MKNSILLSILICVLGIQINFAQDTGPKKEKFTAHNKGKFFLNWGGNREEYSKSDITFSGKDYNFTLYDVIAVDKPKGWHVDYINPGRMTIPQNNFRMGYYFTDKYSISIGTDHMKYVMVKDQTVDISGEIDLPVGDPGFGFNGVYNHDPKKLTQDFLMYEHTDGLNYVNSEITRLDDVSKIFRWNTDKIQLNTVLGVGGGLLFPKTNTTLMSRERHDDFHVSGYGMAVKVGLNLTIFKYFFIQTELKAGYINMPDIRTTKSPDDRASQHFNFLQRNIVFGGIFKI
ncbi:MAG: hypothetical protein V4548_03175 [Bacteroidota bacterium]